ncbi:MAG: DNA-binding protein [Betaproteobacteria bacterium]|nr:DNA-binding protein [Betaproteobacteria bacterium]
MGVRTLFADTGISVAEWARVQGFSTGLVYQVIEGRRKCLRGQSHRIAIALGLKEGLTLEMNELIERLKSGDMPSSATTVGGNRPE